MAVSKRIIASYVLDWAVIVLLAAAGGGLNYVEPKHRPFSLSNLDISFPFVAESISITTLGLVSLAAPAIIIVLTVAIFVPGQTFRRASTRSQVIRRKLWEIHSGLAGLALSVAAAFFITQGLKNLFGRPRPHLLALCEPDLNNISAHVVGSYAADISQKWTLVGSSICQQKNAAMLRDGFRSFPSGHSSFSWSGMLYLSLFVCSKFAIAIPYLPLDALSAIQIKEQRSNDIPLLPLHQPREAVASSSSGPGRKSPSPQPPQPTADRAEQLPLYNQAAAPPTWGIILLLIPLGVAAYITSTRYVEFWHFGFDVFSGALIGIVSAWFAFRWYHLPVQGGQGWAWGPRSRDRAFAIGVGVGRYVGPEGWQGKKSDDVESGRA